MLRLAVIYDYDARVVKTKHHRFLFLYQLSLYFSMLCDRARTVRLVLPTSCFANI
ncbi:MAG: hypothetical protein HC849_15170 [Oscillatoriales cyanobacterium RU_3_3]|nr:hypothetical protein [Microcoleus sp. SU_5_6]NJL67517.1 hypothetical protein [Microcoleus sp. SM1_3_4]NJM61237.1 hypothetical protein [Oscillatoriales cyanobacterium RU_3_3]